MSRSQEQQGSEKSGALVPGALAAVLLFRVWLAARLPLSGDEAYFWEWSRHLAPGYHDHPPLVALAIALSITVLGASTELAVRLPAVLAAGALVWIMRGFTRRLGGELGLPEAAAARAGDRVALLLLLVPIFAFYGVFASGDALLFLCWGVALDHGWRAVHAGGWRAWLGLGAALGLGLQAKFLFLPFLPAFALFLAMSPARRRWFRRPEPWSALALALLLLAPFLLWNARHDWITFRFNFAARHDFLDAPTAFLELAASQVLVLSPVVFVRALAGAGRGLRRDGAELYLSLQFALPLAICVLQSLAGIQVGAHWPAAGAIGAFVLLALHLERAGAARATIAVFAPAAVLTLLAHVVVLLPPGALGSLRLAHPTRDSFRSDRLEELHGWRELGEEVAAIRAGMLAGRPGREVFLLAAQYGFAAQVAFHVPGQPAVLLWEPPRRHGQSYRLWDRFEPLRGQDALFLAKKEERVPASLAELREHFASVSEPQRVPVLVGGRELRSFWIVRCAGFDGAAPDFGPQR